MGKPWTQGMVWLWALVVGTGTIVWIGFLVWVLVNALRWMVLG